MIQKPREIRDLYLRMRGDQSRITVVQVSTPTNFKRNEIQVSLISRQHLSQKFFHPVCRQLIISYKSCYRQSVDSDKDLPWFSLIQKLAHFLKHSDSKLKPKATLVLALYRALASWLFFDFEFS